MARSIFRYIKRIIYNMKIWQNILKIILRCISAQICCSNNLTMIPIWFYWYLPNKPHGYQLGQKILMSPSLTSLHVLKQEWPARWWPINRDTQKQFVSHFSKHDSLLCLGWRENTHNITNFGRTLLNFEWLCMFKKYLFAQVIAMDINLPNMGYHMMGISSILTVWLVGCTDNGHMFNLDWTCLFF